MQSSIHEKKDSRSISELVSFYMLQEVQLGINDQLYAQ